MAYTKEEAKNGIEKLVEDFKRNKLRLQNQAEAQIENNFIRPLFKFLNWNTTNQGLAVADYEFIVNRTGRGGKRPDYTLQLDGQHLLVMDAKQVKYDMHDPRWLNQVYAYGYSTQNLAPVGASISPYSATSRNSWSWTAPCTSTIRKHCAISWY